MQMIVENNFRISRLNCSSLTAKTIDKLFYFLVEIPIVLVEGRNLFYRVHYGRVMLARELFSDLRKAVPGQSFT